MQSNPNEAPLACFESPDLPSDDAGDGDRQHRIGRMKQRA